MNDEQQQRQIDLRTEHARLLFDLMHKITGDQDEESTRRRRAWQCELEANRMAEAELDEEVRVQITKQKVIDIKLVESPFMIRNIGECPLCLDVVKEDFVLPEENRFGRFWCCGATCCYVCFWKYSKDHPSNLGHHKDTNLGERSDLCPFCCGEFQSMDGLHSPALLRHAKAGQDWAQLELGHCYLYGRGVQKNRKQAGKWYKLAADQGSVAAIGYHGCFLVEQSMPGKTKHPMKQVLRAARQGLPIAQYTVASTLEGTPDELLMWVVLSATQGYTPAQLMMGTICLRGLHGVRKSDYAAILWLRKAASKGFPHACALLSYALIRAKMDMFGAPNAVGFSVMPEAVFWFNVTAGGTNPESGRPYENPMIDGVLDICGCCDKRSSAAVVLQKCARCKAIVYCSKACQTKHWKLGHNIDCKSMDKIRLALKEMDGMRQVRT